jgi:probable F420-dependent oxidoreductase
MRVELALGSDLTRCAERARTAEDHGLEGLWSVDAVHDAFTPLVLAGSNTSRPALGTAVAVAFARNPMSMAIVANDVHLISRGRLSLGLGSQVRAHIERRFSMEWSHPARRMREYVAALRAIWAAWANETDISFEGDFYRHTLNVPGFRPSPNPFGVPKVLLSAVGPLMTSVCGEVADGLIVHPFTTLDYLEQVTIPTVRGASSRAGRSADAVELVLAPIIATASTAADLDVRRDAARRRVAFYASTPSYRVVLEQHGWGDLQPQLQALTRRGAWDAMGDLIDDAVLDAFAVVGDPPTVAAGLVDRFATTIDRLVIQDSTMSDDEAYELAALVRGAA